MDEVVVIIANRHRNIPSTTKVLDTDVAEDIWHIFLQDTDKVRVEIAPGSAVKHAFSYLERAEYGDSILFCLGEADFAEGDTRFENLRELVARKDIHANIIAAPTGHLPIRATALRASLVKKDAGKAMFMSAMPANLSDSQRENIWQICQSGMKDSSEVTLNKVRVHLEDAGFECSELDVVKPGKSDEVYRAKLTDGARYFVKYANDTVKAAKLTDPSSLKPRQRLSVERRAIKWIRANIHDNSEVPEVVYFNKENKTLMLSEVCPGDHTLERDLERGVFDTAAARRAARFMAKCHNASRQVNPLWGDQASDIRHWQSMLALRLDNHNLNDSQETIRHHLKSLHRASDTARINGFMHLDFCPKNVLVGRNRIGVIDLELSSSIGDPAYDLGFFLGHYVVAGLNSSSPVDCQKALQVAVNTYQKLNISTWPIISPRVVAFAGVTVLYRCEKGNESISREGKLMTTAYGLLSMGHHGVGRIDEILCDAAAGNLRKP